MALMFLEVKTMEKTWFLTETPVQPGDESKIVELKDGTWMVNSRANNKGIRYSHTQF